MSALTVTSIRRDRAPISTGAPAAAHVAEVPRIYTEPDGFAAAVLEAIEGWPLLKAVPASLYRSAIETLGTAVAEYREFYRNAEIGSAHLAFQRNSDGGIRFLLRRTEHIGSASSDPTSSSTIQVDPLFSLLERIARRLDRNEVTRLLRERIEDDPDFPTKLHDQIIQAALAYRQLYLEDCPLMSRIVIAETKADGLFVYLQIIEEGVDGVRILHPGVYDGPMSKSPLSYKYESGSTETNLLDLERLAISDVFPVPELTEQALEGPVHHAAYQLSIYALLEIDRVGRQAREFLHQPVAEGGYSVEQARLVLNGISNVAGQLAGMLYDVDLTLNDPSSSLAKLYDGSDPASPLASIHESVRTAMFELDNPLVVPADAGVADSEAARKEGHVLGFTEHVERSLNALEVIKVHALELARRRRLEGIPSYLPEQSLVSIVGWINVQYPSKAISVVGMSQGGQVEVSVVTELLKYLSDAVPDTQELIYRSRFSGGMRGVTRSDEISVWHHPRSLTEALDHGLADLRLVNLMIDDVRFALARNDTGRARFRVLDVEYHFNQFVRCHRRIRDSGFAAESQSPAGRLAGAIDVHDWKVLCSCISGALEGIHGCCLKDPLVKDRSSLDGFLSDLCAALSMVEATYRSSAYLLGYTPKVLDLGPKAAGRCFEFLRAQYPGVEFDFSDVADRGVPADVVYGAALKAQNIRRYGGNKGTLHVRREAGFFTVRAVDQGNGFVDRQGLPIESAQLPDRFDGHSNREGGGTGNQLLREFADQGIGLATKANGGTIAYMALRGGTHPDFPAGQVKGSVLVSRFAAVDRKVAVWKAQ